MTKNTISYKNYEETKRHNLVTEQQQNVELDRKNRELLETMRNNMRNYGINIEKNQITKLANDQLDQREANKLLESIRSNLANENLKLQANLETARSNKEKERLESELNAIKRMDSLLSNAKATGKTADAILLSWLTNQANLEAFAGTNVPKEVFDNFKKWMYDSGESKSQATSDYLEKERMGSTTPQYYVGKNTRSRRGTTYQPGAGYGNFKPIPYETYQKYEERSKRKEKDEKPEDFTNSLGPGGKNEGVIKKNETLQTSGYGNKENQTPNDYDSSSESRNSKQSNVIYSGGSSKTRENSGPGIGIAFS